MAEKIVLFSATRDATSLSAEPTPFFDFGEELPYVENPVAPQLTLSLSPAEPETDVVLP